MDHAYIFDTETTGFKEPEVIQAASIAIDSKGAMTYRASEFFKPSKPIELGALAVHHILESQLVNCRPSGEFSFKDFVPGEYVIGHNIDYDWEVCGKPPVFRICTLAMARCFWPKLDTHSQSALMYLHFGDGAKYLLQDAHDAAADVDNLRRLWEELFLPKIQQIIGYSPSWQLIWQLSEICRIPKVMGFGKYKGTPVAEVDSGYMQWYLRQDDVDPYYEKAFREQLAKRRGK